MSNSQFLHALLQAVIALTISAAVLIGGLLVFPPDLSQGNKPPAATSQQEKLTIHGSELAVRLGKGIKNKDKTLQITELAEVPDDHRAIATRFISFDANDFPLVEYKITGRHPGTYVYLLWKTDEDLQKVHTMTLHWSGDKTTAINMAKVEEWTGRITELGIDVYGDLRGQPLNIVALNPMPYSSLGILRTIWSEWTAFEGWTQKSINYLRGTPENPVLSPTVAMAAWGGLAFVLLGIIPSVKEKNVICCGVVILVPWSALDMLWQSELSTQLEETKYLFQDKNQHEKHLAERDSDLYLYAQHLKEEVLPEPGIRIFLVHDSDKHNFKRLRTQFHLLPHNVYNYGRSLRKEYVRTGDYILVLGEIPGLKFLPRLGQLKWSKHNSLTVTRLDRHEIGNLYQITAVRDAESND